MRNVQKHECVCPFVSYSESFKPKRGRLNTADESKEHIHHGRCVDMLEDQREESLLPTQKTKHLKSTEPLKKKGTCSRCLQQYTTKVKVNINTISCHSHR